MCSARGGPGDRLVQRRAPHQRVLLGFGQHLHGRWRGARHWSALRRAPVWRDQADIGCRMTNEDGFWMTMRMGIPISTGDCMQMLCVIYGRVGAQFAAQFRMICCIRGLHILGWHALHPPASTRWNPPPTPPPLSRKPVAFSFSAPFCIGRHFVCLRGLSIAGLRPESRAITPHLALSYARNCSAPLMRTTWGSRVPVGAGRGVGAVPVMVSSGAEIPLSPTKPPHPRPHLPLLPQSRSHERHGTGHRLHMVPNWPLWNAPHISRLRLCPPPGPHGCAFTNPSCFACVLRWGLPIAICLDFTSSLPPPPLGTHSSALS